MSARMTDAPGAATREKLQPNTLYLCRNCGLPFAREDVTDDGSHAARYAMFSQGGARMVCTKAEAR